MAQATVKLEVNEEKNLQIGRASRAYACRMYKVLNTAEILIGCPTKRLTYKISFWAKPTQRGGVALNKRYVVTYTTVTVTVDRKKEKRLVERHFLKKLGEYPPKAGGVSAFKAGGILGF